MGLPNGGEAVDGEGEEGVADRGKAEDVERAEGVGIGSGDVDCELLTTVVVAAKGAYE